MSMCDASKSREPLTVDEVSFLETNVQAMIQRILSAIVDDALLIPRLVSFLDASLTLIVRHLRTCSANAIKVNAIVVLSMLFDGDANCKRFYSKYGVSVQDNPSETFVHVLRSVRYRVFFVCASRSDIINHASIKKFTEWFGVFISNRQQILLTMWIGIDVQGFIG